MMLNYSSEMWSDFVRALGNHLWQSTLFGSGRGIVDAGFAKEPSASALLGVACSVREIPDSLFVSDWPW